MATGATAMDRVTVEGCALRCVVEGEADRPALVLSHMLGTDLTLWDGIAPELARRFRVVRLDARGHGGSALGDAPVTVERLGRDVVAVLDALGIERAHFCGISMGGAVGLWLLAHAPARIERAVIAGSAAKLGTPAMWNERIAAALAGGINPEATIERWFSPGFTARAADRVEAVRNLLRGTSPEGYAACCGALRDLDLREAMRAISHPVLVVHGRDDPSVSAEDAAHLVEAIDGAALVEFDVRHCSLVEAEAEFAAAVLKFLTATTASRRAAGARAKVAEAKNSARTKVVPQVKSAARRVGARGIVAARQPVARTVPVSGKAVAKASATRKAAARTAPRQPEPAPSRRRAVAKPARAAAARTPEKTAAPKEARKAASAKASTPTSGRAKPAAAKLAPVKAAGKAVPASAKRGSVPAAPKPGARKGAPPSVKLKPTAAALRAAAAGRSFVKAGAPAEVAKATAKKPTAPAPDKIRAATAKAKPAPAKTKLAPAKTKTKPAPAKTKPAPAKAKSPRAPARRGKN